MKYFDVVRTLNITREECKADVLQNNCDLLAYLLTKCKIFTAIAGWIIIFCYFISLEQHLCRLNMHSYKEDYYHHEGQLHCRFDGGKSSRSPTNLVSKFAKLLRHFVTGGTFCVTSLRHVHWSSVYRVVVFRAEFPCKITQRKYFWYQKDEPKIISINRKR